MNLKINIHFVDIFRAVFGCQHSLLLLHEVNPELKVKILLLEAVELVVVLPHGEVGGALGQAGRVVGDAAVHLPRQRLPDLGWDGVRTGPALWVGRDESYLIIKIETLWR